MLDHLGKTKKVQNYREAADVGRWSCARHTALLKMENAIFVEAFNRRTSYGCIGLSADLNQCHSNWAFESSSPLVRLNKVAELEKRSGTTFSPVTGAEIERHQPLKSSGGFCGVQYQLAPKVPPETGKKLPMYLPWLDISCRFRRH
jgi:hypothetical protein